MIILCGQTRSHNTWHNTTTICVVECTHSHHSSTVSTTEYVYRRFDSLNSNIPSENCRHTLTLLMFALIYMVEHRTHTHGMIRIYRENTHLFTIRCMCMRPTAYELRSMLAVWVLSMIIKHLTHAHWARVESYIDSNASSLLFPFRWSSRCCCDFNSILWIWIFIIYLISCVKRWPWTLR